MNFIRSFRNFPGRMNGWKECKPSMKNKACMLTTVHQPYDTRIFHKEAKSLAKVHNVVLIAPDEERDASWRIVRVLGEVI